MRRPRRTAGKLLVIASDNVERLRSDAAFAALCGVSPIEASSGKSRRHRLTAGVLRCLKRHLARRLYRLIIADLTADATLDLT